MPYKNRDQQRAAQRQHYRDNVDLFRKRQNDQRKRSKDHIWNIKLKSACSKCGNDNPIVLDFHHRDKLKKEIGAAGMIANKYSNKRIDIELKKCDVVCANCHRIIHSEIGY